MLMTKEEVYVLEEDLIDLKRIIKEGREAFSRGERDKKYFGSWD